MQFIKRLFRILFRLIILGFTAFIAIIVFFYITCPIYNFPEPEPFAGDNIFNPYTGLDSNNWRRANFQIQSHAWLGLTGGSKNTNERIDSIYTYLNYDVITTSDYMKINRYGSDRPGYIPVYEHGYGTRKFHQVLIGSEKVTWRDYPFFQTLHHKQHIIKILRKYNDLIFIAHPKLRHGYHPEDMKYLTGYEGIEVLNYMRFSPEHLDAALSSGKYVTIMGNDDGHDLDQILEIGHRCTYIYSASLAKDSIIRALSLGRHFGGDFFRTAEETLDQKAVKARKAAKITMVEVVGDTLWVAANEKALEYRFIGQNGTILKKQANVDTAYYRIKAEDTYVRTEIIFKNKNTYFLNPVARHVNEIPSNAFAASVNWVKTIIFWAIAWIIYLLLLFWLAKRFIKKWTR